MTANPPHLPAPGEGKRKLPSRDRDSERNPLSGGIQGILAVTLATLTVALAAAVVAGLVAWAV